ncbi:triggering receptor expressed on myeloid cells 3-like isoform X3 [Choloepus didactylus]|uniref:triggering receptor expressed on myeloid cells 3-like isoform X3 n=1 Tax=Choloepus didactylus TaxID=27675 RepID=UPI00189FDC26|nr:triggering receptor expressed on myeloid cells 3-like isoform X3 [Choloepus didactylus]
MEGTGLREWPRLLLLLLCVSGFEAVGEKEEEECLIEGKNLTVICPYNIMKYSLSRKAWQRVGSQGPPETLVTMAELQKQDVGLYQCVVDLSPREPIILHQRIRLIQCDGMREAKPPPVLVIVLACGFILNKGLVFSVLFVLVWKTWASGEAAS